MASDEAPSGREFEALTTRVDNIDEQGTRGTIGAISLVQAQLGEQIKGLGELKGALAVHEQHHSQDRAARASARRWLVGIIIAVMTLLVAILAIVVPLALRTP